QLQAVRERWRQVLDGMVAVGDLSRSTANTIFSSDLVTKMVTAHKARPAAHGALTAHFVDYIVSYIKQRYGDQALYEGGLTITTTLDLSTQTLGDKGGKRGGLS